MLRRTGLLGFNCQDSKIIIIFTYNLKTKRMKTLELVTLRALQVASFVLGTMVIIALGYAAFQIATGNVHGTASFEF